MFPAAFLTALENRHLNGRSVARYFDLIAGTSTGGIIALGLGAGGLFANNPIMVALADVLSCFSVPRDRVRILNIGCGTGNFVVDRNRMQDGAIAWRKVIEAAMQLQSLDARGQAGLLIGAEQILRIEPHVAGEAIELDDWTRAIRELVPAVESADYEWGETVAEMFLTNEVEPYEPCRSDTGSPRRADAASSVDAVGSMELAM